MEPETYVEDKKLDHIRLVCSSAHCTTTKPDINGKKHLVHKTICMEHYKFKSGVQQYFLNPEFADCEIMNEEGKCRKCGCAWTMHMATRYETVEKKKSTDKEVEDESEDEYEEEEEPPKVQIKSNGDALIQIQNFNEPQTPRQLKRSQSQRHPNRLNKLNEPKRKSEERSIPIPTEQPKMIIVPVEVKEEPKVVENKKPVRSKSIEVSKEAKVVENKKPVRSKTTSVDPTQLPKSNINSNEVSKQRPKTTEVSKEHLPIKELKKEVEEEEEEETVKPKYRTIKFKTTSVTNQDLETKETPSTDKNDIKPPKFKTTAVDSTLLQPNVSNEKSVDEQKEAKSPNETKSTRRSIRFKFFGADGKEEKSPKRESKSPPKSPSKSPTKSQKFDKWKTPSQKPPESPTKLKKPSKQKDDFDEISEVLQSRAEDYAPSTKLLRFSDIIHIVDKEEEKENEEESPSNQHDDASTVYTNVDRNSVVELKFDKQPPRRQSNENNNSFRKMGRVLNRPEQFALIGKAEASTKVPNGKSDQKPSKESRDTSSKTKTQLNKQKSSQPKTKVTTVRFGQNDEPTIASSTITRASKPVKLNSAKSSANPSKQNGHLPHPNDHPTDEDFAEMNKELQCADDDSDEVIEMLDSQMDTRSERCRRWLIDNSIAPPPRPEKFLQRLKKTIVRAGTRLKNAIGGGRSSGQETSKLNPL